MTLPRRPRVPTKRRDLMYRSEENWGSADKADDITHEEHEKQEDDNNNNNNEETKEKKNSEDN